MRSFFLSLRALIVVLVYAPILQAQEPTRLEPVTLSVDTAFVPAPTVSTNLVSKGGVELNQFNLLRTSTFYVRQEVLNLLTLRRDTLTGAQVVTNLDHVLQVQVGLTKRANINVGLDLYGSHVRYDIDTTKSVLAIFAPEVQDSSLVFRSLAGIGPRIRWVPFRNLPELSIQSSAVFSLVRDADAQAFLGRDRTQWLTQIVFYQQFGLRYTLFSELDVSYFFKNSTNETESLGIPLFLYLSAQLNNLGYQDFPKFYGLVSFSHTSNFSSMGDGFQRDLSQNQVGLGLSGQLGRQWALLLFGQTNVAESTFSTIPEIVSIDQRNAWGITLGLRYLFSIGPLR